MTRATENPTQKVLRTVEQTIAEHGLFRKNDAVLVGLSGGPDSVALLWCIHRLGPRWDLRIGAAHLNHGLRGRAADTDADFAAAFAEKLNIPCYAETADVNGFRKTHRLSLEEAARRVRHRFLSRIAADHGFSKIALGHHADDNAELVLMNFLRGSGMAGLGGIPVIRPMGAPTASTAPAFLVRPLMGLNKADILLLLRANRLDWRTDRSNRDTRHLRNRIRHDLIPVLKKHYNPGIVDTLNRTASVARCEEAWIIEKLEPIVREAVVMETRHRAMVSIPLLIREGPSVARRILRTAIMAVKGDLRKISYQHIQSVLDLCHGNYATGRLDLPDRVRAERTGNRLLVLQGQAPLRDLPSHIHGHPVPLYSYELQKPGTVLLAPIELVLTAQVLPVQSCPNFRNAGHHVAFFDMDTVYFPLIIRNMRSGDTFRPLGAHGTQKVKKFFSDKKVPVSRRRECPLLVSAGRVIWVAGYRMDERVKVTDSTKTILRVELASARK